MSAMLVFALTSFGQTQTSDSLTVRWNKHYKEINISSTDVPKKLTIYNDYKTYRIECIKNYVHPKSEVLWHNDIQELWRDDKPEITKGWVNPYTTKRQLKEQNKSNSFIPTVSYRHFQNMETTGAIITVLGISGMIGGAVMYFNGLNDINNINMNLNNHQFDKELNEATNKSLTGLYIAVAGEVLFDIGLPFWIVGGIKSNKLETQLTLINIKTPKLYGGSTSVNGIGLKIRF